jgi:hypothetical protein
VGGRPHQTRHPADHDLLDDGEAVAVDAAFKLGHHFTPSVGWDLRAALAASCLATCSAAFFAYHRLARSRSQLLQQDLRAVRFDLSTANASSGIDSPHLVHTFVIVEPSA